MKGLLNSNEGIPQDQESLECPESVLEYLKKKHETIKNLYRTPDGRHSENCSLIALEIAELFLQAGRHPDIRVVSEQVTERGFISSKSLTPIMFRGLVEWSAHVVCCCSGKVYDPLLSEPVRIEAYTMRVFGEHIAMRVEFSADNVAEVIAR